MDWITFWTLLIQIGIALALLTLPLGLFVLIVCSAIERGLSKPTGKNTIMRGSR